jgi:hypothetical protein
MNDAVAGSRLVRPPNKGCGAGFDQYRIDSTKKSPPKRPHL